MEKRFYSRFFFRTALFCLLFSLFSFFPHKTSVSAADIPRYFSETGHFLGGDFLTKYNETPNAELIYGSPITEAFYSPSSKRLTQYFEKARFELYPENPPELRIRVTPIGELLHAYQPGQPLDINTPLSGCKNFLETGYSVCYSFLDMFNQLGGVRVFGYPISNLETQDGLIVQYFQLSRFEWHGNAALNNKVQISDLGRRLFELSGEDKRLLAPLMPGNNAPQIIHRLQIHGFTELAVTPQIGSQTVFIIVQDQNNLPVTNALVAAIIDLPDGQQIAAPFPLPTDNNGLAKFNFNFQSTEIGLAIIRIEARYDIYSAKTVTSFRIWK
ncbi:MAG: hypothetical protein ACPL0B_01085 [Anaerolineales bacterium]